MNGKDELNVFATLFKQHLNGVKEPTLRWVSCTKVDWDAKTMQANDAEDLPYFDVILGLGQISIKPVEGTDCLIAIVEGDQASAFLLFANEVDLIQFNDGTNGGLLNSDNLLNELKKLSDRVEAIDSLLKKGGTAGGVAVAFTDILLYNPKMLVKEDFSLNTLIDNKIMH